jgi:hypothetical protein
MSSTASSSLANYLATYAQSFLEERLGPIAAKYNLDLASVCKTANIPPPSEKATKKAKAVKPEKASKCPPLPYNGVQNMNCCIALDKNFGLYTQCKNLKFDGEYCMKCQSNLDKNGLDEPIHGTIEQRLAYTNFMAFTDSKGNKPTPYLSVLKKRGFTPEQAREYASSQGVVIDAIHWIEPINKRGRPKKQVVVNSTESEPDETIDDLLDVDDELPPLTDPEELELEEEEEDDEYTLHEYTLQGVTYMRHALPTLSTNQHVVYQFPEKYDAYVLEENTWLAEWSKYRCGVWDSISNQYIPDKAAATTTKRKKTGNR